MDKYLSPWIMDIDTDAVNSSNSCICWQIRFNSFIAAIPYLNDDGKHSILSVLLVSKEETFQGAVKKLDRKFAKRVLMFYFRGTNYILASRRISSRSHNLSEPYASFPVNFVMCLN
ncbi:hypothetical protein GJ496_008541 [Pomphorhynchus laevis]|nr:hypothetical protein GJ496_008541 [Pomphorhynchus laevis]